MRTPGGYFSTSLFLSYIVIGKCSRVFTYFQKSVLFFVAHKYRYSIADIATRSRKPWNSRDSWLSARAVPVS
jgi:hypothetical protein